MQPRGIQLDPSIAAIVSRQWRAQIAARLLIAGLVMSLIVLVVTALTVTKPVLDEWVAPAAPPDGWTLPGGVYVTVKHVELSVLLGALATVAFAGLALAEDKLSERFFKPERARIRGLLTLAGTYEAAMAEEIWKGRVGETWPSYVGFLSDDPARRHTSPQRFGKRWRADGELARWRAAWNPATGELYVLHSRPPGQVEILAMCDSRAELESALAGWREREGDPDSLTWLRRQALALRTGDAVPAAKPA